MSSLHHCSATFRLCKCIVPWFHHLMKKIKSKSCEQQTGEKRHRSCFFTACCPSLTFYKMLLGRKIYHRCCFWTQKKRLLSKTFNPNDVHLSIIRRPCPTHDCIPFFRLKCIANWRTRPYTMLRDQISNTIWHISHCLSLIHSVMLNRDVVVLPSPGN